MSEYSNHYLDQIDREERDDVEAALRIELATAAARIRELEAERDALREATTEIVSMLWKRMAEGEQRITSTEARVYQKLRATLAQINKETEDG